MIGTALALLLWFAMLGLLVVAAGIAVYALVLAIRGYPDEDETN